MMKILMSYFWYGNGAAADDDSPQQSVRRNQQNGNHQVNLRNLLVSSLFSRLFKKSAWRAD